MDWMDVVAEVCRETDRGWPEQREADFCRLGRTAVGTVPELMISRQSKRQKTLPALDGDLCYTPLGEMTMSAAGMNMDFIEPDEVFWTRVSCEVMRGSPASLNITPKAVMPWQKNSLPWKVQTDLSEETVLQVQKEMAGMDRAYRKAIRLRLVPMKENVHLLTVETDWLPEQVHGFRVLKDCYPTGPDGRELSDGQAAVELLKSMAALCRAAWGILTERK